MRVSAYYAEADQQHWDGANCQEVEGRRGRVATAVVVPARNVDAGNIGKTPALKIVQQLHGERDAQRPDSMDESVRFDNQGPFQIDMHRSMSGQDGGAEVLLHRVSCGNEADSARWACC